MTEKKKTCLTPDECMAFALECESMAQIEQEFDHRDRLLKMAAAMRDIAAALKSHKGIRG
jgi:hypothetical protein